MGHREWPAKQKEMAVKIRLARHGKKRAAFYHIVVADARSPRDGRFIEKLGTYNPNTNPATINLNFDSAVQWLANGAQPTDTARAILSYKGVLLKRHLDVGVAKGALTEEQAQAKLDKWLEEKGAKVDGKAKSIADAKAKEEKERLEAEAKVNEARAAEIAAKNAELAGEVEEVATEEATEEVAETVEATAEETPEAPAEEATEEKKEEE